MHAHTHGQEENREATFLAKEAELRQAAEPLDITCFRTSIWDETLYKAWYRSYPCTHSHPAFCSTVAKGL